MPDSESDLERDIEAERTKLWGDLTQTLELTGREDIFEVFEKGFPAFGGKHVRTAYQYMRKAIGDNYTMFMSLAGPITLSGYSDVWVIPFIKAGWLSAFTASDAISYHDSHRPVMGKSVVRDVDMWGDDPAYFRAGIIRVTDLGFPEEALFDSDKFMSFVLQQPEFQRSMTTTEFRWELGRYLFALEEKKGVKHGLLATAFQHNVPGYCPSPADGSVFLNAVKTWALRNRLGESIESKLSIDLQKDVYEFAALHLWGQNHEGNNELAYTVCGGGAVKNYMLQPEPFLEQILKVPTKKYKICIQFYSGPVTDGSLSTCPPNEAIPWGKVEEHALTIAVPVDYTQVMTFIAHALLKERALYQDKLANEYHGDEEQMFREIPQARGFLRKPQQLYAKREQAMAELDNAVREHKNELMDTLHFNT